MELIVGQILQVLLHEFLFDSVPSTVDENQHGKLENLDSECTRSPDTLCGVPLITSPAEEGRRHPEEEIRKCSRLIESYPVLEIFRLFMGAELLAVLVKDLEVAATLLIF